MALSETDRDLLRRCLAGDPEAWHGFVDRFLGLITHVVNHSADSGGVRLSSADREDCIADVFLAILDNDKHVLRKFQGRSSLATYLAVVARRIVVRSLLHRLGDPPLASLAHETVEEPNDALERIENQEQVELMIEGLADAESRAIRLYHLEGKSYQEISNELGMPINSIGPLLSRARSRLRSGAEVS